MADRPRIALIHATRVAIDPIEAAARTVWPDAETITILEESLSVDRAREIRLSETMHARILALADYAKAAGADGVLFTCSAFGPAIEAAANASPVPIMKPNEAMFEAAFAHGDRIALMTTFKPAAAGMEDEFRDAAQARGSVAGMTSYYCSGALDAKRLGNQEAHDQKIAELASRIEDTDVILLGQFSMAGAAMSVRAVTDIPVITGPESAMREIRRRVENHRKRGASR